MPPSSAVLAVAAAAVLLLLVAATTQGGVGIAAQTTGVVDPDSWVAAADHGAPCTAETVECVGGGAAAGTRRELAAGRYISYNAMSRGRVPCSIRGASYYNCRPGGPANPYSRGCSAITRCRG